MNGPDPFRGVLPPDPELDRAAGVAVREALRVQPGERVLIVTNPAGDALRISAALYGAAQAAGARPSLVIQPKKTQLDSAEEAVYAAMATEPQVVVSISEEKLGKDRQAVREPYRCEGKAYDSLLHYLLYGKKSVRGFWSPQVTRDLFVRTVPLDYPSLRRAARGLRDRLAGAGSIRITSPAGTDLAIGLAGRGILLDDGEFSRPGSGGNLPAGEVFFSPELGTARGRLVFDGSVAVHDGVLLPGRPIRAEVEGGFVTGIAGGAEAERLEASIQAAEEQARRMEREGVLAAGAGLVYARNARNLGEVGIGLNPRAVIVGNMLVDEKVYGTCHLAIGSNYDEDAPSLIHLDGLVRGPTIRALFPGGEERPIMEDGRLVGVAAPEAGP